MGQDSIEDTSRAVGKDASDDVGDEIRDDAGRQAGGDLRVQIPCDGPGDPRDLDGDAREDAQSSVKSVAQPDAQSDTHEDEPGAARPGAARPGAARPDAARPDAARPDAAMPDAAARSRRGRADNLERHGTGWRVRIRPPQGLVTFKFPRNLRITIGPAPYELAARTARAVRVEADRLFEEVVGMNEAEIEARLGSWRDEMKRAVALRLVETGRMFLSPDESARMDAQASGTDEEPSLELDQLMRVATAGDWSEDLVRRALAGFGPARAALAPVREAGFLALGLETRAAQAEAVSCIPYIYRAWIEAQRAQEALGGGDPEALAAALTPPGAVGADPGDREAIAMNPGAMNPGAMNPGPMNPGGMNPGDMNRPGIESGRGAPLRASPAAPLAGPLAASLAAPASPEAPAAAVSGRLFDAWDAFVENKITIRGDWKESRRPELASTRRVFVWLCDDPEKQRFDRSLLMQFQQAYLRLPHDYRENPNFGAMNVDALVDWSKKRDRNRALNDESRAGYVRVSPKSFNKHLSTLKAYVNWLALDAKLPRTVSDCFAGLHVSTKNKKGSSSERLRYNEEQVRAIFASPVFMGRRHKRFLTQPGPLVIRDSLYWVPLICAYHGMRREEVCQLRVRHVREKYGIWHFDLNARDLHLKVEQSAEDDGSRRSIPLHRDFLALGFLEDKIAGRPGNAFLFEELSAENAHSAFGNSFGKRFGRYLQRLGIVAEGEDAGLHRLRHNFNTELVNNVENVAFVEGLMGHTSNDRKSERARYTDELFLQKLKLTIDRLVLPIDVAALNAAVARAAARPAVRHRPSGGKAGIKAGIKAGVNPRDQSGKKSSDKPSSNKPSSDKPSRDKSSNAPTGVPVGASETPGDDP